MAIPNASPSSPVCYVPPQIDSYSTASKRALQESPARLFLRDTLVLLRSLRYLPWIFLPLGTKAKDTKHYPHGHNKTELALQGLLFVIETILLVLFIPAFILLPGLAFLLANVLSIFLIWLLALPMEGSGIVYSVLSAKTRAQALKHDDERWIFINGCASGHYTLQSDINCLSYVFGRSVIGIHNKTYGLIADILECLVQRTFEYKTTDVRIAYDQIRSVVCDPTVSKVVLIGHSQGGIVISLVIDQLLTELPPDLFTKVEVFTFDLPGSAASHFSNPPVSSERPESKSLEFPKPKLLIPHIEHYANEYDMVPRWGVLNSTQSILSNRYAGSVFVHMRTSGHMFVEHYINRIFVNSQAKRGPTTPFLDQVVNVDERTVSRREQVEIDKIQLMRSESGLRFGDGERVPGGGKHGANVLTFDRTGSGRLLMNEARGKTLRMLSRLWRYQGGNSPE